VHGYQILKVIFLFQILCLIYFSLLLKQNRRGVVREEKDKGKKREIIYIILGSHHALIEQ
jgi:hypothetical protein